MGNPYLNNDESIILATHNVISRSVRSDVILTNQRIILSDSSHTQFRPHSIPLAVIITVTKSETATGDPVMTLALATQDGATQPRELVFLQKPREKRSQECDEWVKKLGELAASAREEAARTCVSIADLVAEMAADEAPPPPQPGGIPAETLGMSSPKKTTDGSCRRLFTKTSSAKARILAFTAIVIVVIALVVGAYINSMPQKGSSPGTVVPTTLPAQPSQTTPVPTAFPQQTLTTVVTTIPTPISEIPVPRNGVWVRVESPVNYIGTVGISGWQKQVNATGVQFYQIPAAQTDMIDISLQKQSGYGDPLTVRVYNNGELVKLGTTTTPRGIVEMHVSLKTA